MAGKMTAVNVAKGFHPDKCDAEQLDDMHRVSIACLDTAEVMLGFIPDCADLQTALRCLREASMWANKAIASKGEF